MARTALTKLTAPGSYDVDGAALAFAAGDAVNGNQFTAAGKDLIVVHNADGVSAHTVTIKSVADDLGRTGDLTVSVPANAYRVFGPVKLTGFIQTDGKIYVDVDNASLELAVIDLSNS